jgi:hypothetical protein
MIRAPVLDVLRQEGNDARNCYWQTVFQQLPETQSASTLQV